MEPPAPLRARPRGLPAPCDLRRRFTLAAAGATAASAEIGAPEVLECVANLVANSIVAADADRAVPSYRLLETTRAYALEKLHESGEFEQVQQRHAAYFEGSLQSGRMK